MKLIGKHSIIMGSVTFKESLKTAKVLVPAFVGIFTIVKVVEQEFDAGWLSSTLLVIGLGLLLVPIITKIRLSFEKRNIPILVARRELAKQIVEVERLLANMTDESDVYKVRWICYRLKIEILKYEAMANGVYQLYCLNPQMYFMYIFRSALEILSEGDKYRAVTTIKIWAYDTPDSILTRVFPGAKNGTNKSFLKANIMAARRGVEIERYFIVCRKQMEDITSDYHSELKDLVQRIVLEMDENLTNCRFFFCPTDEYEEEVEKDIAFALIRSEEHSQYAYLRSNMDNSDLPYVDVNFVNNNSEVNYRQLYQRMRTYRDRSASEKLTLDQMAKKLGLK